MIAPKLKGELFHFKISGYALLHSLLSLLLLYLLTFYATRGQLIQMHVPRQLNCILQKVLFCSLLLEWCVHCETSCGCYLMSVGYLNLDCCLSAVLYTQLIMSDIVFNCPVFCNTGTYCVMLHLMFNKY